MMWVSGVTRIEGRNAYIDRDGRKYGIAIHCTANLAPARGEADYATRRTDGVSAHFYVDGTEVIQSLDTAAKAGHAGSIEGNENAVAVEVVGLLPWSRQRWLANVCWPELARVLAVVCRAYEIQPRRATVAQMQANPRVQAFYDHNDMRQAWGGTTHTDPGPNFPWDHLLALVAAELEDTMTPDQFLVLLADERVRAQLRALPWQYPVTPQLSMLNAFTGPNGLIAQIAQLRGQIAGLSDLVRALATQPETPLTDAQLAALTASVETAARDGARELGVRLAAAVRAEADALNLNP